MMVKEAVGETPMAQAAGILPWATAGSKPVKSTAASFERGKRELQIYLENPRQLVIAMEYEDLVERGLSFSTLHFSQPASKAAIGALLAAASAETGFTYTPGRLLIEAFPGPELGCVFRFTALPKKRRLRPVSPTASLWRFSDAEHLLSALERLHRAGESAGTLWLLHGQYYLQLPLPRPELRTILAEYGQPVTGRTHFSAYAEEHGRRLCTNAVQEIGSRLAPKQEPAQELPQEPAQKATQKPKQSATPKPNREPKQKPIQEPTQKPEQTPEE